MIKAAEEFGELENYKNAAVLKNECIDLAIRIHYDNMVRRKNELDSSGRATPDDYMALAKEFREARGYADTENLAKECENRAVNLQYNQLLQAKNNASTEDDYQSLAQQFRAMNGYANTIELANECDNQYHLLKKRREEQEKKELAERERRAAQEQKEQEEFEYREKERKRREEQENRVREAQERTRIQSEEVQLRRFLLGALITGIVLTAGYLIVKNNGWFSRKTVTETSTQGIQPPLQRTHNTNITTVRQTQSINSTIPGRFPQASERLLTASDLQYLSKAELEIMRNEIFARHGYIFQTQQWKAYFQKQSWYSPQNNDVNSLLTDIELKNIPIIKGYE